MAQFEFRLAVDPTIVLETAHGNLDGVSEELVKKGCVRGKIVRIGPRPPEDEGPDMVIMASQVVTILQNSD